MNELDVRLRPILASTPARWMALAEAVPLDLFQRIPVPGEWSAIDCLRHLRDVEFDVFQSRVQAFRNNEELVPYDPDWSGSPAGESPIELAADFANRRSASLALLSEVTDAELDLTAFYPQYSRHVRLGEMLTYWAAHDLNHTIQAERALLQPFAEGSGPWRVMLADNDLSARSS